MGNDHVQPVQGDSAMFRMAQTLPPATWIQDSSGKKLHIMENVRGMLFRDRVSHDLTLCTVKETKIPEAHTHV